MAFAPPPPPRRRAAANGAGRGPGDLPRRTRRDVEAARGRAARAARAGHGASTGAGRGGLQAKGLQEGLRALQPGRDGRRVFAADGAGARRHESGDARAEQPVRVQIRLGRRGGRVQGRERLRALRPQVAEGLVPLRTSALRAEALRRGRGGVRGGRADRRRERRDAALARQVPQADGGAARRVDAATAPRDGLLQVRRRGGRGGRARRGGAELAPPDGRARRRHRRGDARFDEQETAGAARPAGPDGHILPTRHDLLTPGREPAGVARGGRVRGDGGVPRAVHVPRDAAASRRAAPPAHRGRLLPLPAARRGADDQVGRRRPLAPVRRGLRRAAPRVRAARRDRRGEDLRAARARVAVPRHDGREFTRAPRPPGPRGNSPEARRAGLSRRRRRRRAGPGRRAFAGAGARLGRRPGSLRRGPVGSASAAVRAPRAARALHPDAAGRARRRARLLRAGRRRHSAGVRLRSVGDGRLPLGALVRRNRRGGVDPARARRRDAARAAPRNFRL
mmetsp:Transcript_2355/g.6728  ORF Transcript_2355/g.6728 Transcript_2355/m.6728 type:complete len:509 (+) Transcript_2355:864-2390(+)